MKKKYREITVDGQVYAWRVDNNCDGDGNNFLTVWLNKEKIYAECIGGHFTITPKYVAEFIKFNNLLVEKNLI